jgi:hypothetical protein
MITYASPAWGFTAGTYLKSMRHQQNRVLRTVDNCSRRASVPDLLMANQLPYVYEYITKLLRQKQRSYKIIKVQVFVILD